MAIANLDQKENLNNAVAVNRLLASCFYILEDIQNRDGMLFKLIYIPQIFPVLR
ncbi:MAG: hypothetical protein AAGE84_05995 [Cyanobacteria bacterium P01_G01_bin.39]